MTFRQLQAFLALVRERSFSRAAGRIHLSQPTLSSTSESWSKNWASGSSRGAAAMQD